MFIYFFFFFSSRRRHTRSLRDWSSNVCSSDLLGPPRVSAKVVEDLSQQEPRIREALGIVGAAEKIAAIFFMIEEPANFIQITRVGQIRNLRHRSTSRGTRWCRRMSSASSTLSTGSQPQHRKDGLHTTHSGQAREAPSRLANRLRIESG